MTKPLWDQRYFLEIIGVAADVWAKRYGIAPFTEKCTCGRDLTTVIPWAQGEMRGLRAPQCECGSANRPYCVVRDFKCGDLFDVLNGSEEMLND